MGPYGRSLAGGKTAVVMLILVMTAKAAGINPRAYIRDVFLHIAREGVVRKLTPHGWRVHFGNEVEAKRQSAISSYLGS